LLDAQNTDRVSLMQVRHQLVKMLAQHSRHLGAPVFRQKRPRMGMDQMATNGKTEAFGIAPNGVRGGTIPVSPEPGKQRSGECCG
jgi:hypothetical protein